jgi:hypothetical protein
VAVPAPSLDLWVDVAFPRFNIATIFLVSPEFKLRLSLASLDVVSFRADTSDSFPFVGSRGFIIPQPEPLFFASPAVLRIKEVWKERWQISGIFGGRTGICPSESKSDSVVG